MKALTPFYNRIHVKLDSDCTEEVYEFLYKTSLKNDMTILVIDGYNQKFIDETSLFKDILFNIKISSDEEIKDKQYLYFCEDSDLDKITLPDIGVYHDFSKPYTSITKTNLFNIDETFNRNYVNDIIATLMNIKEHDSYTRYILEELKAFTNVYSVLDSYLLETRHTLFLDNVGNFYSYGTNDSIKLGNILTDDIDSSIFKFLERKYYSND